MQEPSPTRSVIARRVREERKRLDWTLDELAARASVSRGMISKIERGQSDPSAALLARLADAMEVGLSALMTDPPATRTAVRRAGEQPTWTDPSTAYDRRVVWPAGDPDEVEVVAVELPAGRTASFPAVRRARAQEQVLLLQGRLSIEAGEERFELGRGDCVLYPTDRPHAFVNAGPEAARYLVLRVGAGAADRPRRSGMEGA